ncbi:MAG: DUF1592 domain-containing protein [Planctomycetaceae bacterium]|nr:DUF1592 domain-containing protein [Planctomycetaceae bacterium]
MSRPTAHLLLLASLFCLDSAIQTATADDVYSQQIAPYMQKYCMECHNDKEAKGELDLTKFSSPADVINSFRRWNHVIEFIRQGEMPPEDSLQPTILESNAVVDAIRSILFEEARKNAGDPGVILPRRLSNTEFNHAVHDLTGIDIQPTRDFPADPAGGEGFDNTGEALRMSPNLLKKYLAASQLVADHMVLKPDGMFFAPFPVTSYNERKKLTEQAIIDFYNSHDVDTLDYLRAAWLYRHRPGHFAATSPEQWAAASHLSGRYFSIVWKTLSELHDSAGLFGQLRQHWDAIPAPDERAFASQDLHPPAGGASSTLNISTTSIARSALPENSDQSFRPSQREGEATPAELIALRDYIDTSRSLLSPPPHDLIRSNAGNWPISHLDFRATVAAARDTFAPASLKADALIRSPRISAPRPDQQQTQSLFLKLDHAFNQETASVIIRQPIFSSADRPPQNDQQRTEHKVRSLRQTLEEFAPETAAQLQFGRHPISDQIEIDPESFVATVPSIIEIPLSAELREQLNGLHLLLPCRLDTDAGPFGSVLLTLTLNEPPASPWNADPALLMNPDTDTGRQLATEAASFCNAFPNAFFYVDNDRGLAAGFHLVEGFFRDDQPLVQKVLTDQENAKLNQLWQELDFVTESAETLLRGFVWFERSEREVLHDERFDFLRAEDPDLVEEAKLAKFEKLYLDRLGVKRKGDTVEAETPDHRSQIINGFFDDIRHGLARQKELTVDAEQHGLNDLAAFAARACRHPLSETEWNELTRLYRELRAEGQTVEASLRGVITAILMSPQFSYRYMEAPGTPGVFPLTDHELADRLSFFLWSSIPDADLLAAAESGQLRNEEQLRKQLHRMLKDERINAFATEFFGQWLRYRDYLDKDPVNGDAFPGYTDHLRQSIFEEPGRMASHLIQSDAPLTSLLNGDVTFVNQSLADHYGGDIRHQFQTQLQQSGLRVSDSVDPWYMVTGLQSEGRGGLLGTAIVLTKNSAGERTSPVKRGFWTVHHLLGQHFPPPPAEVPELPKSEKEATQTIRELLAAHVADAQCALCHKHFDSLGLAMEGFDPIGRSRTKDSAGRAIDNLAELPNGENARGIPELSRYIEQHRRQEFIQTLCRRFLGYALGRSVKLSDEPLLMEMEHKLAQNGDRFSILFETVVNSPQFRMKRGSGE